MYIVQLCWKNIVSCKTLTKYGKQKRKLCDLTYATATIGKNLIISIYSIGAQSNLNDSHWTQIINQLNLFFLSSFIHRLEERVSRNRSYGCGSLSCSWPNIESTTSTYCRKQMVKAHIEYNMAIRYNEHLQIIDQKFIKIILKLNERTSCAVQKETIIIIIV